MTLHEASQTFEAAGLDKSILERQEQAFQLCLSFLTGIKKTKCQNHRHTSYGYKHMVEQNGYVYEGTFILAALASGFTMRQRGQHLNVTFNISQRSLLERRRQFAKECAEPERGVA
jgi:hypothetical protein